MENMLETSSAELEDGTHISFNLADVKADIEEDRDTNLYYMIVFVQLDGTICVLSTGIEDNLDQAVAWVVEVIKRQSWLNDDEPMDYFDRNTIRH